MNANWHSVCTFTGRYQWRGYDEYVGRDTAVHIHLPGLTARQTIMMMDNLSRLKGLPVQDKIKLFKKVGGHPKTIELLNGWLATGTVNDLLADDQLDGLLTRQWEDYFLRDLLAQLPARERRRLSRLAIFQAELSDEALAYAEIDGAMVNRWLDLSLLQKEAGGPAPQLPPHLAALLEMLPPAERARLQSGTPSRYSVHPVVADYLLGQTSEAERRELHRWAAAFYGTPFVQIARDYAARTNQNWTDEEIEQVARNNVVRQLVAQTDDMGRARGAMARALDWQRHLFAAGAVDAADDIVTAVIPTLDRWGERDRAKGLLRRSIDSLTGDDNAHVFARAAAQGNLATMLQDEGKLDEALATYQDVYETFAALDAKQQMAAVLTQMASVYQDQGKIDEAIEHEERSMVLEKERGNEEGQATSLHQLSILYHMKEDYKTALARSEAAEALARKVANQQVVAATLHQQGITYNRMFHTAMARTAVSEQARGYREMAAARFQASLDISRRIGNESGAGLTLGELGKMLLDAGQLDESIVAFNEALAIARNLNEPVNIAMRLEFLGLVHERQGQYAAALAKYREALALMQQYSSPQDIAIVQNDIARVSAKMG